MELYFHKFTDETWGVAFDTTQGEMPAVLNDMVKAAVKAAVEKFNKM